MSTKESTKKKSTDNHLGEKVRARKEEERNKRKEIVRLDADPALDSHELDSSSKLQNDPSRKRSSFAFENRLTTAPKRPRKKRKPAARRRSSLSPSGGSDGDGNGKLIDSRTPDVSQVISHADKSSVLSSVVRIHGVPVHAQKADIRRFFSGLDVERVFVLPTNRAHILGWDGENICSKEGYVERHANSFRVFCKFSGGAPVAALATQRTGEVLYIGSSKNREGAAIAVTQITKSVARYLERNLAVDCEPGGPLQHGLINVEETLDEIVLRILWSAVIQNLHLAMEGKTPHILPGLRYEPLFQEIDELDPSTPKGYQHLVGLHNSLFNDRDTLTNKLPFPAVVLCGSTELSRDVAIFLRDKAAQCLQRAAQRIDENLRVANAIQRQSASQRNILDQVTARYKR